MFRASRRIRFETAALADHSAEVERTACASAERIGRTAPNIEDRIRAALQLIGGLEVLGDAAAKTWVSALDEALLGLVHDVLRSEREVDDAVRAGSTEGVLAHRLLVSFLLTFASRTASRERLNLFTTNYDRLVEFGCDLAGLRPLDRFVGALEPVFRASRLDVDLHYNPPGIRGEPRYLEGVLRLGKIHGSLDWRFKNDQLRRVSLPFGAADDHPSVPKHPGKGLMIYPNPAKDLETLQYPYAELFRDLSAALCRPNSALVSYGYGFGDDHINRVIADMLSIPSTHMVVIAWDWCGGRLQSFMDKVGRDAQISLLIGPHFGDLETLVTSYLPKPAIDTILASSERSPAPSPPPRAARGTARGRWVRVLSSPVEHAAARTIGTVESVAPNEVRVVMDLDAPQAVALNAGQPQRFPRINGFVLIPNEVGALVGLVSWLGVERSPYPKRTGLKDFGLIDLPFPLRKLSLVPLGTLLAEPGSGELGYRLERGVISFPSVGDPVLLPSREQLRALVEARDEDRRVVIGISPLGADAQVSVDPDKLFGRHLAVLGNTGSGKSCSVAGLIRWSLDAARSQREKDGREGTPNARFLVLDPNGEYRSTFADVDNVRIFQVAPGEHTKPLRVPAWIWNSREWAAFAQAAPGTQRPLLMQGLRNLRAGATLESGPDVRLAMLVRGYKGMLQERLAKGPATYVGNFMAQKGLGTLLETLARDLGRYVEDCPDVEDELSALMTGAGTAASTRRFPWKDTVGFNGFDEGTLVESVTVPRHYSSSCPTWALWAGPAKMPPCLSTPPRCQDTWRCSRAVKTSPSPPRS